jgi:hypothetical protein
MRLSPGSRVSVVCHDCRLCLAGIFAAMPLITGRDLGRAALARIARDGAPMQLDLDWRAQVQAARVELVARAAEGVR